MQYRVRLATLLVVLIGMMWAPTSSVMAQDIESAKANCDVETLVNWAWGDADRVTELERDLTLDCLIAVTESATTVTDTAEASVMRAAATYYHVHHKKVETFGLDQYSTYTDMTWTANGTSITSVSQYSSWYTIHHGSWRFVSKQTTHNSYMSSSVFRYNVIFDMKKVDPFGNELYRSTQNTLCGKASGGHSYNFDCS